MPMSSLEYGKIIDSGCVQKIKFDPGWIVANQNAARTIPGRDIPEGLSNTFYEMGVNLMNSI